MPQAGKTLLRIRTLSSHHETAKLLNVAQSGINYLPGQLPCLKGKSPEASGWIWVSAGMERARTAQKSDSVQAGPSFAFSALARV